MTTAEELSVALERLFHLLREAEWAQVKQSGITPLQRQILWFIHTFPTRARAVYIGRYLGIKKPTVSLALKQMEKKGLIRRELDPLNRRSRIIRLSEQGAQLIKHLKLQVLYDWCSTLSEDIQQQLKESLYGLFIHLNQMKVLTEVYFCETCERFIPESGYCEAEMRFVQSSERRLLCMKHSLLAGRG